MELSSGGGGGGGGGECVSPLTHSHFKQQWKVFGTLKLWPSLFL